MDEATLVALLKERDQHILAYVYDVYAPSLYGIIYRIVRRESIAEELLQDTLVKVWDKIDTYDPKRGRFFTWMMQMARNLAIDYLRSKENTQFEKTDVMQNSMSTVEIPTKNHDKPLQDLLDRLPPEQREAINLVYFAGYTQAEAAKKLDVPLGTIKTMVRSALIKLRKLLQISP